MKIKDLKIGQHIKSTDRSGNSEQGFFAYNEKSKPIILWPNHEGYYLFDDEEKIAIIKK